MSHATFPEDNQRHAMIYQDQTIHTLNEAVRMLYRVSNPILCYTQRIAIRYPTLDRAYENHVRHNEEQGLFYLTFPEECAYMARFRSNLPCKMVTYYRDMKSETIKEIEIKPDLQLRNHPQTTLVVYTRHQTDLILSYDVYLMKRTLLAHL